MPLARNSFLGVDVGGTDIKWSTVDDRQEVLEQGEIPTCRGGRAQLVQQVVDVVRSAGRDCSAVGLAMPGVVNPGRGQTCVIPNISGEWRDYPIAAVIGGEAGKPVRLLNDARAFGYAEMVAGAGRGLLDALFLTVGTGVGGALVRNGRMVLGELDCVPEMGHVVVAREGERCGCGATGCLETVASASAIVAGCMRAVITGQSPVLTKLCEGDATRLSARKVAEAADEGDPWALGAFQRAGTFIGMAAASSCVMLQLHAVVIGGGLAGAFHHLAPWVQSIIDERASITGPVRVLRAELGPHAGSIGAALHVEQFLISEARSPALQGEGGRT